MSRNDELRARFVRGVVVVGGGMLLLFSAEFAVEFWNAGFPGIRELSWGGVNNTKLVDSLSPIARAYNNVLAMLIATVGLAIPLTANMSTPTLIDLFIQDRLNRIVLALMAVAAGNVLFVMYLVGPEFAPMWTYRLAVYGALIGWAVLIPYFWYVIRFLDPASIVQRLQALALAAVRDASRGTLEPERAQDEIQERMFQIGTMVIKATDRADRSVLRDGVWALKELLDDYGAMKPKMAEEWFTAKREDFVGMSHHALDLITTKRTWLETHAAQQLLLCYDNALVKAPDAASTISNAVRKIAQTAAQRDDHHVVSLCTRTINSFLRSSINRKDPRSSYEVFYQYRQLGGELLGQSDHTRHIGSFIATYGGLARDRGLREVASVAAFDLAHLAEKAARLGEPMVEHLVDHLLAMRHIHKGQSHLMVLKAKIVMASALDEYQQANALERVKSALAEVPHADLLEACRQLVGVEKRQYYEITDRAINVEWTAPERRERMEAIVMELTGVHSSGQA